MNLIREFCQSQYSTSPTLLQTPRVNSLSTQYMFSYFGHPLAPRFARMARLHCICQSTDLTLLLLSSCSQQRQQSYIAGGIVYGVCLQQCHTISYFKRPIYQRLRIMMMLSSPHQEVLTVVRVPGGSTDNLTQVSKYSMSLGDVFCPSQAKGYTMYREMRAQGCLEMSNAPTPASPRKMRSMSRGRP